MRQEKTAGFEPVVVAYCCTYCAYTAGDLAGSMRLEYAPEVRVVKIPCTGKVDAALLLRALEDGADAVYVAGCAAGDCHFREGNLRGKEAVAYAKKLIAEIGLDPERLEFFHIPASAGPLFAERANEMTARVLRLGPNPLRQTRSQPAGRKLVREPDPHPPLPQTKSGCLIREAKRGTEPVEPIKKEAKQ